MLDFRPRVLSLPLELIAQLVGARLLCNVVGGVVHFPIAFIDVYALLLGIRY